MDNEQNDLVLKENQAKILQEALACLSPEQIEAVTNAIRGAAAMNQMVAQMGRVESARIG